MSSAVMREIARDPLGALGGANASYYAEDGWVFREIPGKGIECVGRYEDLKSALADIKGLKALPTI
jgi:hypothetical protein